MITTSDEKSNIIQYLERTIQSIKLCNRVLEAKVDVSINNDILTKYTNFVEYNISIKVEE
jgi:hypothetical protein